jgi:hypothetical protein
MTPAYWEDVMPLRESPKVNLDALIPRQDMASGEPKPVPKNYGFGFQELIEGSLTQTILRKPDFQRETASWTPEKVRDMVVAYVNGETVPAIIVWRSPQNDLFVIDGAHRLSSVIAWINDDYGDGTISKRHFGEPQSPATAQKTRELVEKAVGNFAKANQAPKSPADASELELQTAKILPFAALPVQDLKGTDVEGAERSFFKINEQGVILTPTEKWMLHSRNCPNSIAARAVSQRGLGNAYWNRFEKSKQDAISKLAKEVYALLFEPALDGGTLKTTDVPVAGQFYATNALNLIFQFINNANDVRDKVPRSREEAESIVPRDLSGDQTIFYLQRAKRLASLLSNLSTTNFSYSVDLHPFVYFYSGEGKHQPTMFLAVAKWMREFERNDSVSSFLDVRAKTEDFLIANRFLIASISRKVRGEEKAVVKLKKYLDSLVEHFKRGSDAAQLLTAIGTEFQVLTIPEPEEEGGGTRFSPTTKSALFVEQQLEKSEVCSLCKARVTDRALSADHRRDRKLGGTGSKGNYAPTHHACNSGKDRKARKATVTTI